MIFSYVKMAGAVGVAVLAAFLMWKAYDFGRDVTDARWVVKHQAYVTAVQEARIAERERMEKAIEAARQQQNDIIVALELEAIELERNLEKLIEEANADPDANKPAISRRSVQRLNSIRSD